LIFVATELLLGTFKKIASGLKPSRP